MNNLDEDSKREYLEISSEEELESTYFFKYPNLRELSLSGIGLDSLPEDLASLVNLKILDLSDNLFNKIPEVIKELETLEELDIKENHITSFSPDMLPENLKKLDISSNRLSMIPENINKIENLTWLDISDNYITKLPETICSTNLSYIAFEKNKKLFNNYPECIDGMDIITCKPIENEKDFSTYENEMLYNEATDAFHEEDYERSIELFNKLLKDEENDDAYYTRGFAYFESDNYSKAADDFAKAIELGGESERYVAAKGVAHSRMDDFEEAVFYYSKAIEFDGSVRNYENRAIVYKDMGEYEKAVKDYTKAIQLSEDNCSELYVLRAAAFKSLGEFENSWKDLERAYEADPYEMSTYLDSIEMFFTTEFYSKALDYIKKHENHILEYGSDRDMTIFFYLKTLVYTCCNMDTEDIEEKIWSHASETSELEWYFGHILEWVEDSKVQIEKKKKIEELTNRLDR